jgi:hypothetical protein
VVKFRFLAFTALFGTLSLTGCMSLITGGPLLIPGRATGTIEFVNQTSNAFDVVLISECDVGSYGLNRLPDSTEIPPGKSYQFTVSTGCWDVAAGTIGVGDAMHRLVVNAGQVSRYTVND